MLNSLTFPIQLIIQSNIKDITDYIRLVKKQELKQKNPLLLAQLKKYRSFIEQTIKDNQVLDKKFYVSIPFSSLELGVTVETFTPGSIKKKQPKLPYPKSHILERAKMNLYPKRDHLMRQFNRIGLNSQQLNTQQLLELFYRQYNRDSVGQNFVNTREYEYPIVEANIRKNIKPTSSQAHSIPATRQTQSVPLNPNKASIQFPNNDKHHGSHQGIVSKNYQVAK